jgi:prepilin-type N-terminal cleavage/methylation domain-containing protein
MKNLFTLSFATIFYIEYKFKYNNHKKLGFSLIELLIVLMLLSCLFSFTPSTVKYYKSYKNSINVDYCSNSILIFINNAKQFCRATEQKGIILFDYNNGVIRFHSNNELIDTFILPQGFKINAVTLPRGKIGINIDSNGTTGDACTISYRDMKGSIHNITISVGSAYVEIKEP